jgi:hypothetical protein
MQIEKRSIFYLEIKIIRMYICSALDAPEIFTNINSQNEPAYVRIYKTYQPSDQEKLNG